MKNYSKEMRQTQKKFSKSKAENNEIEIMINSSKKVAEKMKNSTEKLHKDCRPFEDILDAKYGVEGTPVREDFHKRAKKFYDEEIKKYGTNMDKVAIKFNKCKTITDVTKIQYDENMNISEETFDKMKNDKFKEFGNKKCFSQNQLKYTNPFENCNNLKEIDTIYFDRNNNLTPEEHYKYKCEALEKLNKEDVKNEVKELFDDLKFNIKLDTTEKNKQKEKGETLHEKYNKFLNDSGRVGDKDKKELLMFIPFDNTLKGIVDTVTISKSEQDARKILEDTVKFHNQDIENYLKNKLNKKTSDVVGKIIQDLHNKNSNHKSQANEFGFINQYPLTDEIKLDCIKAISGVPLILNDVINDCGDLGYAIGKVLDIEDIDNFITGLNSAKIDKLENK